MPELFTQSFFGLSGWRSSRGWRSGTCELRHPKLTRFEPWLSLRIRKTCRNECGISGGAGLEKQIGVMRYFNRFFVRIVLTQPSCSLATSRMKSNTSVLALRSLPASEATGSNSGVIA